MAAVVPDVAIVSYNTDYYLLNLLRSLELEAAAGRIGDIHVWDNASSDDTAAMLEAYQRLHERVSVHRSNQNVQHGPALDRLLREHCRCDWVLVLDVDTELRHPLDALLRRERLGDAAFAGQIHPQMPQLYAYLAHLLLHRPQYLELPPFRHHGAPGIDYFRAIEEQQRPYLRVRWADYVRHFGQGALRRIVERGERTHEFYRFAAREQALRPADADRRAREEELRQALASFLRNQRAARGSGVPLGARGATTVLDERAGRQPRPAASRTGSAGTTASEGISSSDATASIPTAAATHESRSATSGSTNGAAVAPAGRPIRRGYLEWLRAPRRMLALRAARRLGLTQVHVEALRLMELVEHARPRRVLEIGTAHGGSFLLWAHAAARDALLVSVDLPPWEADDPAAADKRRAIENVGAPGQRIHLIRGNSHAPEVRDRVTAIFDGTPIDFLFIDGDHSYDGVRADFEHYAGLVRAGGMIALHDIQPHSRGWGGDVPRFWQEIKRQHRHVEIIADPRQDGYGLGVLWLDAHPPVEERGGNLRPLLTG